MLLILRARLHPSLALLISAIALGAASGMPLKAIPASITTGVGNLLGHVALVLGLGAVLGHLLASSGGAAALGATLVNFSNRRGPGLLPIAMLAMGILVGLPVFFEVGLVLLLPIVMSVAKRTKRSPIVTAMPTLAGLSIVHGLIPPHPAAMLAVAQYHADVGRTILLGLAAGLPAALIAGPGYALVYQRIHSRHKHPSQPITTIPTQARVPELESAPSTPPNTHQATPIQATSNRALVATSLTVLLLPVALIFLGSWADALIPPQYPSLNAAIHLLGDPPAALLIAVLIAQFLFARICHWTASDRLRLTSESFAPIAGVLLILAAAGALSRILSDSGAAQATVALAQSAHLSPLILAWLLAATVRLAIGSATVAMAVTTGILAPVAITMNASGHFGPELLVLATGAGSLFCSHVNDPGFWMIKEFFSLELSETLATWSILETILSTAGLLATLLLAAILH